MKSYSNLLVLNEGSSVWLPQPLDKAGAESVVTLCPRPYHALLLLESEKALLSQLPLDCSPAMVRLIKTCSAVKNLQQLAQDADLALLQVRSGCIFTFQFELSMEKLLY